MRHGLQDVHNDVVVLSHCQFNVNVTATIAHTTHTIYYIDTYGRLNHVGKRHKDAVVDLLV